MDDSEKKLEQKFEEYKELSKENKNIDVAALMAAAITESHDNLLSPGKRRAGYLVSLGLPPFGLIFAIYFYLSAKDDGKKAALICVLLTVFSIVVTVLFFQLILSSSGTNIDQISNIKPQDIQQLVQ